ncbi:MAG: hypothetical protein J7M18_00825 [Candidatus Eremiobacteraeota bacterium]|nr:hypothetical protein [Candidatus Eremiobacteraeota bacterium]
MPGIDVLSSIFSRIPRGKVIHTFIFTGRGGTGKSELALNFARLLKTSNDRPVTFLDLDPVKPCFRSREAKDDLENQGIRLVMTPISSLDIPAISPENAGLLRGSGKGYLVIDLAGEEAGIKVIGGYHQYLSGSAIFWVINYSRPFSRDDDEIIDWKKSAESSLQLPFTGIVHNTHLMQKTTTELLLKSANRVRKLAQTVGLPLLFHGIDENLINKEKIQFPEPVLPLKIYLKPPWEKYYRPQI